MDFFFWGYLKKKVYAEEPEDVEEVVVRLGQHAANINAEMLLRVKNEAMRRAYACLAVDEEHLESTL